MRPRRRRRRGRRRGADRARVGARRRGAAGAIRGGQPAGPRTRQFRPPSRDLHSAFGRPSCRCNCLMAKREGSAASSTSWPNGPTPTRAATAAARPSPSRRSMAAEARDAREALVELVAEADDDLMSRFFDEGTLTDEELVAGLRTAVRTGAVVPVFCASGAREHRRRPAARRPRRSTPRRRPNARSRPSTRHRGNASTATADESAPTRVFVWKTVADPFAGRISCSASYRRRANRHHGHQLDPRTPGAHRHLLAAAGQDADRRCNELHAGDIGAVAKLKDTQTGDTLRDKATRSSFPPVVFPEPPTIVAHRAEDARRRGQDLHRAAPDAGRGPVLRTRPRPADPRDAALRQGQLHIEVTVAKLKRRYKVEVNLKKPQIPYRETIKAAPKAHGRHKKQTGGHGQFGDCKIRMKPLPRGADFQFVDDIFGGSIPRQLHPGGREGHPGGAHARLPRRLPDGRLQGRALRRLLPRRRLQRDRRSRSRARSPSRTR